jgi:hypothetical protein
MTVTRRRVRLVNVPRDPAQIRVVRDRRVTGPTPMRIPILPTATGRNTNRPAPTVESSKILWFHHSPNTARQPGRPAVANPPPNTKIADA